MVADVARRRGRGLHRRRLAGGRSRAPRGCASSPTTPGSRRRRPTSSSGPAGRARATSSASTPVRERVRGLRASGALMTSVCTGSLVYADAGLLDGRRATTYWNALERLAELGKDIEVDARGAVRGRRRHRHGRRRLGRDRHGPPSRRPAPFGGARPRGAPLHPVRPRAAGLVLSAAGEPVPGTETP